MKLRIFNCDIGTRRIFENIIFTVSMHILHNVHRIYTRGTFVGDCNGGDKILSQGGRKKKRYTKKEIGKPVWMHR